MAERRVIRMNVQRRVSRADWHPSRRSSTIELRPPPAIVDEQSPTIVDVKSLPIVT